MSSKEIIAFFILLRAGLWETEIENFSSFPLSSSSWEMIYRMSISQTVTGVVYRGICFLPDEMLPPDYILFRWIAQVDSIQRRNQRMNTITNELSSLFVQQGLSVVLKKGQGIASIYEDPSLRESGDIDFYFPRKQEKVKADIFIKQLGIQLNKGSDGSLHYVWKDVIVEHHSRLIDLYNPFVQGYLEKLENEFGFTHLTMSQNIQVPSPLVNLLLLNAHILKHALGLGIGLRQLCDMARAYYTWYDSKNEEVLTEIYQKTGLSKWSNLLHGALVDYLGVSSLCIPNYIKREPSSALLCIIMKGGNFGHATSSHVNCRTEWQRKLYTVKAFMRNTKFAFKYAPFEKIGVAFNLLKGQRL